MAATTMTATGEVTIPESVRAAAGLTPGTPLEVSAGNGGVLIKEAAPYVPPDPSCIDKMVGAATVKWQPGELMAMLRGDD